MYNTEGAINVTVILTSMISGIAFLLSVSLFFFFQVFMSIENVVHDNPPEFLATIRYL